MTMNIYMIGVGGQGIGLLSEVLIRAADLAGLSVRGVDTHGLAQRGGTVESHLRIGEDLYSPLVQPGYADCVIAMERHEAIRGMISYSQNGGLAVYYDAVWQPLSVRLGRATEQEIEDLEKLAAEKHITLHRVLDEHLEDTRMQNVVLLGYLCKNAIIGGIERSHYEQALTDLLNGHVLEKNMKVFVRHA